MIAAGLDEDGVAAAADAMQAAYFRGCLADEREQVTRRVSKHHEEMARRLEAGRGSSVQHLRSQVRSLEAELRYLDSLIGRLDRRFAAWWASRELTAELGQLTARASLDE
jgi:hypothetical protein